MAFIRKNVMVMMKKMVIRADKIRLSRYLNILSPFRSEGPVRFAAAPGHGRPNLKMVTL